jgi:hypothetical protein
MKILFNGDSNMAGEELMDRSQSMAGVIAKHFDAESVNLSLSGASNERIYSTTLEYLEKNPAPDLVVVGWSEHGREQWYLNGKFHEVNNLGVGANVPEQLRRRYQFWKNYIQRDEHWFRVMGVYWHNKIFNLHTMLLEKNIPHYFFNAFFAFSHPLKEQLDWKNHFFRPYYQNHCYITWCQQQGYEEITPGWQHFDEQAHKAWAEELIKTMCEDIEI